MATTIKARFSKGVLKPLEDLGLEEGEEVTANNYGSRLQTSRLLARTNRRRLGGSGGLGQVEAGHLRKSCLDDSPRTPAMSLASFLIDTDWVIDHLNRIDPVTHRLRELQEQGLALNVISVAELWERVYFSKDPECS